MKIANMKIGVRLAFGFGIVLLLLIILAVVSIGRMAQIHQSLNRVITVNNVAIKEINDMRQAVMSSGVALRNVAVMTNEDEIAAEIASIQATKVEYAQSLDVLGKVVEQEAGKALLAKIADARQKTEPLIDRTVVLAKKQGDVISVLLKDVVPNQRAWMAAMEEMIRFQDKVSNETSVAADTSYSNALWTTIALASVAVVLGLLIAWSVSRSMVGPLKDAVDMARRVADGDLTATLEVHSHDETGQMVQALKDMNASLVHIVENVRGSTDAIATASSEITAGNITLSSRSETQAHSLQQTASSMQELTATVKQNADNARQADSLAKAASAVAVKGGAVVAQVVSTMGSIDASAKKIVDIISVIDGIAFQTNILALNAAVEAARAGDQGRGFAVVASEVRSLAQRSANAAKEIKVLIGDSVEKVAAGTKLVDQAGGTMNEIVTSIGRVTDIMGDIARASSDQTVGIEEISEAIRQMDEATHQNAALVDQASAAARSMEDQAEHLSRAVSVFKLIGGMGQATDDLPESAAPPEHAHPARQSSQPSLPYNG